jgi:tetratricopeptide (TPR) repeat protein
MLLSLCAYASWKRHGSPWRFVLSTLAYVAAVLAKEIALVLAPLVLILELGPFAREAGVARARLALTAGVFFGIAAMALWVRSAVLGSALQSFQPFANGPVQTLALALSILAQYIYKLVFPFALNAEWEAAEPAGWADVHVIAGGVGLALLAWALIRWRHRGEVVFAAAVFLAGIAPVLNIFPITELSAERFLYFPSLGFCLALALVAEGALRHRRRVTLAALAVLIIAYSARTVARNADWHDESTLFSATVAAASENARAHLNLGNVHYRAGRHHQALAEYRRALEIDPTYAGAWSSSAGAYAALGEIEEALRCMRRAIDIEPTNANFHNSLGTLYVRLGQLDEAAASFQRALAYHPGHSQARFNLGLTRFKLGDYAGAIEAFESLEHKDVDFVHAYYYLALSRLRTGDAEGSRRDAETFLSLYQGSDGFRQGAQAMLAGRDPGSDAGE